MKKFFKDFNLLKLMGVVLGIIECGLMTTFLILCREWSSKEKLLHFSIYICFCVINFVFGSLFILSTFNEVLEFIDNKKQNKKR